MGPAIFDTFLASYFLFVGVLYTSTALGSRHRDGMPRIHYGAFGSVTWVIRWTFNLFRFAILVVCLIRVAGWGLENHIGSFRWPCDAIRGIGCGMLLIALALVSYCRAYMQDQWHSGISQVSSIVLLTEGPYRYLRHPMFTAVMLGMLGFVLALPSVFSIICFGIGCSCLYLQANQEEAHLSEHCDYFAYAKQTKKWPWSRIPNA